jgi:nucleoid-associated protein YgaU
MAQRVTAKTITVAGGNLFQIAATELGDATQWNRIAALNGLVDPMIVGVVTLQLPPVNPLAGNGGILNA